MASNKSKLTVISIEQKLEILEELDCGTPVSEVARDYNLHVTTVRRIRRNASAINQAADQGLGMLKQRKLRKATHEKLEELLYTWFVKRKEIGDPITDWLLRQKALELITEVGSPSTFKASLAWLANFKIRYNIGLADVQRSDRGYKHMNNVAAEEFVSNFARQIEEERFEHINIYNMAVSSLMWKALPVRRLVHEKNNVGGLKRKKEWVTVGFCANMTGTHKLKPLFIHRFQHPRALKNIMNSLPVVYRAQKYAWLDQTIFTDWFQNEFKPAVRAYQQQSNATGKVILLLNNCIARKLKSAKFQKDPQFKILFLPPNTTTAIQPMDQGVILKAKRVFHCKMLRHVLRYFESIQEFYDKYNLRDCINLLDKAWGEVSVANIRNSWNYIINTPHSRMSEREEPTDSLEPRLEEVIAAITGEKPCQKKVMEFLTDCYNEESTFSETDARNEGLEEEEEEDEDEEEATEVARHEEEEATEVARHEEEEATEVARHEEGEATEVARHEEGEATEVARHEEGEATEVARHEEEEATEVARHEEEEATSEEESEEEESDDEEIQIVFDKNDQEHAIEPQTRNALEYLMKQTERAPRYVKRSLKNVRDYFLGDET